jgi:hypothetical protein
MIPNILSDIQIFSQVTKTFAICEDVIHRETIGDLGDFAILRALLTFFIFGGFGFPAEGIQINQRS